MTITQLSDTLTHYSHQGHALSKVRIHCEDGSDRLISKVELIENKDDETILRIKYD